MQPNTEQQADQLTQQGIRAFQAGDKSRAYELLVQALELAPAHEQAWLWLSGVVDRADERRYCLERVLDANPSSGPAQRGLSMLPPGLGLAPFTMPAPRAQPEPQPQAQPTPAPMSGLLALIAQPDEPPLQARAIGAPQPVPQPAPAPAQPPPMPQLSREPQPRNTPAITTTLSMPPSRTAHEQALEDLVVRALGRHRSDDEILRVLSEQYQMAWGEAQELLNKVRVARRRSIAARQSPFFMALGIATLVIGAIMLMRGSVSIYNYYIHPSAMLRLLNPRATLWLIGQIGGGLAMVLGSTIGMFQVMRGMFK